jgi:hypothetical protein
VCFYDLEFFCFWCYALRWVHTEQAEKFAWPLWESNPRDLWFLSWNMIYMPSRDCRYFLSGEREFISGR